jgi:peptidoglycan-associated lipoprotein
MAGLLFSCQRSANDVWNDTKTAGRHVSRGAQTIGGKGGDSRQVRSPEEFAAADDDSTHQANVPEDFIAFSDEATQFKTGSSDIVRQPKEAPGEPGSSIPGIEAFSDPQNDPQLARIFENIHFDYNSSLIKSEENIAILQKITEYMKGHPTCYLLIEGHCDARGPAAYNFALGANRANSVRNSLAEDGVSPDRLFTISYGKERPLFSEEGEEYYRLNRRAQFKIWVKDV